MAIVKKYSARVARVTKHAEGVYSLDFRSEGVPFRYYPGQFLHLALDEYDPSSGWPESRCFSMQTPPGRDLARITYAVKGRFTRRMESELIAGSPITLKLPYGELFTQGHDKERTIFVAGGTGITPFLSLFNDPSFKEYSKPVLFTGFRRRSLNFYEAELEKAKEINPSFSVKYYYEDQDGLIDTDNLLSSTGQTFFISGPPVMIAFYKTALREKGVDLSKIKTDDWE